MRPNSLFIIIKDGKILASKGVDEFSGEEFYRLMGGGIEFGEKSVETAIREAKEELGFTLTNLTLLSVIENIFEYSGKKMHEITFLYRADIEEEDFYTKAQIPILDKIDKYAEWISVEDIKNSKIKLFPEETLGFI